jgi:hypothetical protein
VGCFDGLRSNEAPEICASAFADGNIVLDVQMQIPAGVTLVQGTAPQDIPHARQICWTFPPAFGDGEPQMVEFAGPVTVMLKRIPDEYADRATSELIDFHSIQAAECFGTTRVGPFADR